jgi:glucose/mannose-6-phosphate isomerase
VNHPEIDIPITIVRNYSIPNWVDSQTLAIAISYSGNTEETLSCFTQAANKTSHLIGIASGGQLKELCMGKNIPFVEIPGGFQPRAALGYLFFTVLNVILVNFCKICQVSKAMIEFQILADFLEEKGKNYSEVNSDNYALQIAAKLVGKIPVIYSSSDVLDIVNLRWRGQIQENSKNLAFGNFLPEMNHNEINSFQNPANLLDTFVLIFLSDKSDNPKNIERLNATRKLLGERCPTTLHLESHEDMFLIRLFDLIYLADWVSFYFAILNNEDPTPIPLISELKKIMSGN